MAATRTRGRTTTSRDTTAKAPPRSDAYVGLLFISLAAMITGAALLYMDFSQYGDTKPPPLPARPASAAPGGPGAPGPGGPGAGAPAPGQGGPGGGAAAPGGGPGNPAPMPP